MHNFFGPKTTRTRCHIILISIELTYGNHFKTRAMCKWFTAKCHQLCCLVSFMVWGSSRDHTKEASFLIFHHVSSQRGCQTRSLGSIASRMLHARSSPRHLSNILINLLVVWRKFELLNLFKLRLRIPLKRDYLRRYFAILFFNILIDVSYIKLINPLSYHQCLLEEEDLVVLIVVSSL